MQDLAALISTDDIQVEVTIRLGRIRMTIAELSNLKPNDVLSLDQDIGDGVELCVGDKVIGRGELTTSDAAESRLCVRILGPAKDA